MILQEFDFRKVIELLISSESPILFNFLCFLLFYLEFSDVTLIVDNQKFNVHRLILAMRSEYFEAMFFGASFLERDKNEVTLEIPASEVAFRVILDYIYTGMVSVAVKNDTTAVLIGVLSLARFFLMQKLEKELIFELEASVSFENWEQLLEISELFDSKELEKKCLRFVKWKARKFVASKFFAEINSKTLLKFLYIPNVYLLNIEKFKAIVKWLKVNVYDDALLSQLLAVVDLKQLTNNQLIKVVSVERLYDAQSLFDLMASRDEDPSEEETKAIAYVCAGLDSVILEDTLNTSEDSDFLYTSNESSDTDMDTTISEDEFESCIKKLFK